MAKHKHKNPRVNVFFRHQSHFFKLFEAINFGSKSSPELKIKELTETYMQIHDNKKRFDGKLHKGQMIRFIDGQHLEFTYHKDGSILVEIIHPSGEKDHINPYGEGDRWTPMADIITFQPIMIFLISSLASYLPSSIVEKYGLINYIIKNDGIFEFSKGQGALVLIYLRNKNYPLAKYCFEGIYSDVIMSLNDNLDLCIMIQKQSGKEGAGSWQMNSFLFLDKLDGFNYLHGVLRDHIFDPVMADFMSEVQEGGCYFDITEEMMRVIESVDPLYDNFKKNGTAIQVHKPTLVRCLLDCLDGKYNEYLKLPKDKQMLRLLGLYMGVQVGQNFRTDIP